MSNTIVSAAVVKKYIKKISPRSHSAGNRNESSRRGGTTAASSSSAAAHRFAEGLSRKSHFNVTEVEQLIVLYRHLLSCDSITVVNEIPLTSDSNGLQRSKTTLGAFTQGSVSSRGNNKDGFPPQKFPGNGVQGKTQKSVNFDRLDRPRFREFLHGAFSLTDDLILDRIFKHFDGDNDGFVSREEWIIGLSVFLRGNDEERAAYTFDVYDLNNDGFIAREEMMNLLKTALGRHIQDQDDQDEGVKDLIEMCLRKMDVDKDGRISFADWEQAVSDEPLLIEAFGVCLPNRKRLTVFHEMYMTSLQSA